MGMDLYDAVYVRKSVRNYRRETVDKKMIERIMQFAGMLFPLHGETVTYRVEERSSMQKALGFFCPQAPYFLTIYSVVTEGCEENAGYLMQQIALYMVSKGLGCCFTSSVHHHEYIEGMEPLITLAFGWAKAKDIYRDPTKADRLSIKSLCTIKETAGEGIMEVLGAARLAPSSYNSQPWRFVVYKSKVHIFYHCKNAGKGRELSRLNRIDMGIMLANFLLRAEQLWLEAEMVRQENIVEQEVKGNRYYITVRFFGADV